LLVLPSLKTFEAAVAALPEVCYYLNKKYPNIAK
jgi:hypothetical protein